MSMFEQKRVISREQEKEYCPPACPMACPPACPLACPPVRPPACTPACQKAKLSGLGLGHCISFTIVCMYLQLQPTLTHFTLQRERHAFAEAF